MKRGVSLFLLQYLGRVSSAKNWFTQPITLASVSVFSDILCFHTLVGNMTGMFVDARYSTNKYQQHIFGQIIIFHQPRFPWSKWNSFPKSYRNGWGKSVVFWMGDALKVQEAFLANSTKHGVLTLLMYLFFCLFFAPSCGNKKSCSSSSWIFLLLFSEKKNTPKDLKRNMSVRIRPFCRPRHHRRLGSNAPQHAREVNHILQRLRPWGKGVVIMGT